LDSADVPWLSRSGERAQELDQMLSFMTGIDYITSPLASLSGNMPGDGIVTA
jgi:hypothetical protein